MMVVSENNFKVVEIIFPVQHFVMFYSKANFKDVLFKTLGRKNIQIITHDPDVFGFNSQRFDIVIHDDLCFLILCFSIFRKDQNDQWCDWNFQKLRFNLIRFNMIKFNDAIGMSKAKIQFDKMSWCHDVMMSWCLNFMMSMSMSM